VDPTLDIALTQQVKQGQLLYAQGDGWRCSEDDECWLLEAGPDQAGGLVLPSGAQLLSNCWPLLAMWPVLYAFYQGELALGMSV